MRFKRVAYTTVASMVLPFVAHADPPARPVYQPLSIALANQAITCDQEVTTLRAENAALKAELDRLKPVPAEKTP
jgi:hypothetical protein